MTTTLNRRTLLGLGAGLSAAGLLSACGSNSSGSFPSTIAVGTMAPYVELAILQEKGFLADTLKQAGHHADLRWKTLLSMVPMATAVAGGAVAFGHSAPPIAAIAAGQKLTIVATFEHNVNGSGLLVKKNSSITSVADLKGKAIGAPTTTPDRQLYVALKSAGLTLDDVTLKPLEANVGVAGLLSGAVDAYSSFDPYKTQAIVDGKARELDLGSAKIASYNPVYANTDFLNRSPEAVELYLTAMKKAIDWSNTHGPETAQIYASANKISGDLATETLKNRVRKLLDPNQDFRSQCEADSEFLKGQGLIQRLPDWDKAIDDAPVKRVLG